VSISDVIIIAGVLVSVGTALATLAQARTSLRDQGRRIGLLEAWKNHEEGRRSGLRDTVRDRPG
jgi:hypothetical protein